MYFYRLVGIKSVIQKISAVIVTHPIVLIERVPRATQIFKAVVHDKKQNQNKVLKFINKIIKTNQKYHENNKNKTNMIRT